MSTKFITSFTNEVSIGDDGWGMIAPYGDFEGVALTPDGKGGVKREVAIQRLTKECVMQMVNAYNANRRGITKFLTSAPIYYGHPNTPDPAEARRYSDHSPKGVFANIAARDNGFFGEPILTPEGAQLVASRRAPYFSGHWSTELTNDTVERNGQKLKVYQPTEFIAAALCPNPRLPVEMLNEMDTMPAKMLPAASVLLALPILNEARKKDGLDEFTAADAAAFLNGDYPGHPFHGNKYAEASSGPSQSNRASGAAHDATRDAMTSGDKADHEHAAAMHKHAAAAANKAGNKPLTLYHDTMANMHSDAARGKISMTNTDTPPMKTLTKIIATLSRNGIQMTNEATDEQIEAAIGQLGGAQFTNEQNALKNELTRSKTEFTNAVAAASKTIAGIAVKTGLITGAEQAAWESRLGQTAQFTNELTALGALEPKVKIATEIKRGDTSALDLSTPQKRTQFLNSAIDTLATEKKVDGKIPAVRQQLQAEVYRAYPDLAKNVKRSVFNQPKS